MRAVFVIAYDGQQIECPVSVHPERAEIEVMMASGRSNEDVGDRFDLPLAHVPEHEGEDPGAGAGANRGEFVGRHRQHSPPLRG